MKVKFAMTLALLAGLGPASAAAKAPAPGVHPPSIRQGGATFHDRSPRVRSHESQPHH